MTFEKIGKSGSPPFLQLEDSTGVSGNLGKVRTGSKYRKDSINTIKRSLSNWMANNHFEPMRGKQLDVALIIKVNQYRYKKQDVDNIAKVICDALKKRRGDKLFLFNDDSQIIRLLIEKVQRVEDPLWETDCYDISFRAHDPNKQMILIEPDII